MHVFRHVNVTFKTLLLLEHGEFCIKDTFLTCIIHYVSLYLCTLRGQNNMPETCICSKQIIAGAYTRGQQIYITDENNECRNNLDNNAKILSSFSLFFYCKYPTLVCSEAFIEKQFYGVL